LDKALDAIHPLGHLGDRRGIESGEHRAHHLLAERAEPLQGRRRLLGQEQPVGAPVPDVVAPLDEAEPA
jgi:hypothetical protein